MHPRISSLHTLRLPATSYAPQIFPSLQQHRYSFYLQQAVHTAPLPCTLYYPVKLMGHGVDGAWRCVRLRCRGSADTHLIQVLLMGPLYGLGLRFAARNRRSVSARGDKADQPKTS